jgi:DNA-binding SARP family transcriptional activator
MSVETPRPSAPARARRARLEIRLLGELRVRRDDQWLALPASRRTRALLGYIVAVDARHARQTLCDLLWDGPDDPRAALRWSLTKLRPLLNADGGERLAADRDWVAFAGADVDVDVRRMSGLANADFMSMPLESAEMAVAALQGAFLEGLELPSCYRFHQWRLAEQERWAAVRRSALATMVARLEDSPDRALPYARALVAADPLAEPLHATLVKLLAAAGRHGDARAHFEYARDLLRRELDAPLSGALKPPATLRRTAYAAIPAPEIAPPRSDEASPESRSPAFELIGREAEVEAIEASLAAFERGEVLGATIMLGEPGIGKTRLLEIAQKSAAERGLRVLTMRCFEAETVRPFGCWSDALAGWVEAPNGRASLADLSALIPAGEREHGGEDSRARLFASVARFLASVAKPIVLAIDDLHWIDEASASLLHYVLRNPSGARILTFATARSSELEDNLWCSRVLVKLAEGRAARRIELKPLNEGDAALILGRGAPPEDVAAAHLQSGGNPLYLTELARARRRPGAAAHSDLAALIEARVSRLASGERDLIVFASACARDFNPDLLGVAMSLPPMELLERVARLERGRLLKPSGADRFDFAHDLIRQIVYRGQSAPRRRLIHLQIARAMQGAVDADPALSGELAFHAAAAGEHALAVTASIAAGEYCLRVFGYAAAIEAANRGLWHLERLPPGPQRAQAHIALLKVKVFAGASPGARIRANLLDELRGAVSAGELMGLSDGDAALAWHLISWSAQQANDASGAGEAIIRAEQFARSGDAKARCQQLASTGRCLLEVEVDTQRARRCLAEAGVFADGLRANFVELDWGRGLVARWDGDLAAAEASMTRALSLARLKEERWRETECLIWMAKIALERGRCADVQARCDEVDAIAGRIGDDPSPVAGILRILARLEAGQRVANRQRDATLARLRAHDDKAQLAYALNRLAQHSLDLARADEAERLAGEALVAARVVKRQTEIVVAAAILARARALNGRGPADAPELDGLDPAALSARAGGYLALGRPARNVSTLVSTTPA